VQPLADCGSAAGFLHVRTHASNHSCRGPRPALQQQPGKQFPKCLLRFDGVSLLERHLRVLDAAVTEVVLALGFQPRRSRQNWRAWPRPRS
jgi:hypothetical protein